MDENEQVMNAVLRQTKLSIDNPKILLFPAKTGIVLKTLNISFFNSECLLLHKFTL